MQNRVQKSFATPPSGASLRIRIHIRTVFLFFVRMSRFLRSVIRTVFFHTYIFFLKTSQIVRKLKENSKETQRKSKKIACGALKGQNVSKTIDFQMGAKKTLHIMSKSNKITLVLFLFFSLQGREDV